MGTRAFDATLAGIILITPLFLGSVLLLIDIPIFNPINPFSLAVVVLGLCLGLVFGLFAGRWYTKEQLRILAINNEFKGLGSKKITVAVSAALAIFLAISFFVQYFKATALGGSLIFFVVSATFTLFIIRMILITSWEKHEGKIIMMEWHKFYVIPKYAPQF
jgi:hypothetical protein